MKKWYHNKIIFFLMNNILMVVGLIMIYETPNIYHITSKGFKDLLIGDWVLFIYALILMLIGIIIDISLLSYYAYLVFKKKNEDNKLVKEKK